MLRARASRRSSSSLHAIASRPSAALSEPTQSMRGKGGVSTGTAAPPRHGAHRGRHVRDQRLHDVHHLAIVGVA
jgi:hypothetical protein